MTDKKEKDKAPKQPPGAPDNEPIKEPKKKSPVGDPKSPSDDKTRLK